MDSTPRPTTASSNSSRRSTRHDAPTPAARPACGAAAAWLWRCRASTVDRCSHGTPADPRHASGVCDTGGVGGAKSRATSTARHDGGASAGDDTAAAAGHTPGGASLVGFGSACADAFAPSRDKFSADGCTRAISKHGASQVTTALASPHVLVPSPPPSAPDHSPATSALSRYRRTAHWRACLVTKRTSSEPISLVLLSSVRGPQLRLPSSPPCCDRLQGTDTADRPAQQTPRGG
jgi:hypothetical protein